MADQSQAQSDNPVLPTDTSDSPIPSPSSDTQTNLPSNSKRPESFQMADDDQKLADENKQPLESPVSEEDHRPESSIPANPPSDSSFALPPDQTTPQEARSSSHISESKISEASVETQRPVSSEMADENKKEVSEITASTNIHRPESSQMADEQKEASQSAQN